ncbi:site-specific DNA-methyltransferase [Bacilli bacterium]|nr:DNA methylase [Bacilli bacterium VT-13-104]PZD84859.1 site-specific DNA-methyltransferase [Bacilli bacterium]PZD86370.1 site-specific DNA-methyltransferase [Bacilli bacterium]PZD89840.1 site-specific DNA-methyltransferase [Bacilli bacterium]RCO05350.1 site-specific DNA-methyltransferase [Bacilli bacterium]
MKSKLDKSIINKYINDTSLNIKKHLPIEDQFIDLIITSPPYWNMKDYGSIENQTGYGQTYEEYLSDIKSTFKNIYDLSKDSATLYLIVDTMKRDGKILRLPDDIADELESIGWLHQDTIIWDKGKTLPWSRKGQMRNTFEYILMFTKGIDYKYYIDRIRTAEELKEWWINYPERYNPKGKAPDNIWKYFIPTQGSWGTKKSYDEDDTEFKHACPFPPEMMARLILLSSDPGDVILDPYAGTGIMLATAEKLNRNYIGFDTNANYKNIFERTTRPLVQDKWPEIQEYYRTQELLKNVLQDTILKLRILKYPKALVKKLRTIDNTDLSKPLENSFSAIFAFQLPFNNTSNEDTHTIGKVNYLFFWDDLETIEQIRKVISEVTSKPPFSKYGLDVNIEIIHSDSIDSYKKLFLDNHSYTYVKGITTTYREKLSLSQLSDLINSDDYKNYFDKDIPPIFSNIELHEDDYKMIPAIKYEKGNS